MAAAEVHCSSNLNKLVCGGYLGVRTQRAQVALQVSVGHQLHHHQGGLPFGHHTQQTHLEGEDKDIPMMRPAA